MTATYWISGLSTIGSNSFGMAFVAGKNLVPNPATGKTALRILYILRARNFDGISSSLDDKGLWFDNRMFEYLWLTLKYDCFYFNTFKRSSETKTNIQKLLKYHKAERPHSIREIESYQALLPPSIIKFCPVI